MGLFNIFKKKKKMSIKELYAPVLDEMWVCAFNFCPWDEDKYKVFFKKVKIVRAEATKEGIWVKSDEPYPFESACTDDVMCGYIDKIDCRWYWIGFFETKEEAEKAYVELTEKWIDRMKKSVEEHRNEPKKDTRCIPTRRAKRFIGSDKSNVEGNEKND